MNRRERDDIQLVINSMNDVLSSGFAPWVNPVRLVGSWRKDLAALIQQKTCMDCGGDVKDGEYDLCQKCEQKFHDLEKKSAK